MAELEPTTEADVDVERLLDECKQEPLHEAVLRRELMEGDLHPGIHDYTFLDGGAKFGWLLAEVSEGALGDCTIPLYGDPEVPNEDSMVIPVAVTGSPENTNGVLERRFFYVTVDDVREITGDNRVSPGTGRFVDERLDPETIKVIQGTSGFSNLKKILKHADATYRAFYVWKSGESEYP